MDYLDEARHWLGRKQRVSDILAPGTARAMCALLDRDDAWARTGVALPPLWHWLYLHLAAPQSRLGNDGHERLGEFLPPLPYPRRMWAGGRVAFLEPLLLGEPATRISTVAGIEEKQGRAGPFVLVTVHHQVRAHGGPAIEEEQQLAYLPGRAQAATVGKSAAADGTAPAGSTGWTTSFQPTPTALFRFSALTFNAHRIHWDRSFATEEGYPDLVVHAPLLALLLLDGAVAHAGRAPAAFRYRARSPLYAGEEIHFEGADPAHSGGAGPERSEGAGEEIRARAGDRIAMTGTVSWT